MENENLKMESGIRKGNSSTRLSFDSENISFFNEKEIPIQQKYYPENTFTPQSLQAQ